MAFIDTLIKETENEYAKVASDGLIAGDILGYTDTGSLYFNALISSSMHRGLPDGKVTALAGPSGTGKTYILLSMIRQFLDDNPEGYVFLFESESALTKQMLVDRGIDTSRVVIVPVVTVQEFRNQVVRVIDKYLQTKEKNRPKLFFGLDSLGMLSTSKEMDDASSGSDKKDMTRAQLVRSVFRVITLKIGRANVPMVITNHTYKTMDMFSQQKMSGGDGIVYAASTIIFLGKMKEKEGKVVTGAIINCLVNKGRLTREGSQCQIYINFNTGLHRYYGLVQVCTEMGLWEKVNSKTVIVNTLNPGKEKLIEEYDKWFTDDQFKRLDKDIKLAACGEYAGLWTVNDKNQLIDSDGERIMISKVRKDPRQYFTQDAIKAMIDNDDFWQQAEQEGTFGVVATTKDIATNPEKYFTDDVLDKIERHLYLQYAYGAILEDENFEDELPEMEDE